MNTSFLPPVVIIGIGEMAGVFARGLLRLGHPVYPVLRTTEIEQAAAALPDPAMVLLAVAEKDLHTSLAGIPVAWRDKLALLQNELLPRDWRQYDYTDPTVVSVWFEKKKGQDAKILIPSVMHGPHAGLLQQALACVDIPSRIVGSDHEMLQQLVIKNVYILTTNIAGLEVGGTVEQLWREHQTLARAVAHDVIDIQTWLTVEEFDRDFLIAGMVEAMEGDPQHQCMGRSAQQRLTRALQQGFEAGLAVNTLREIGKKHLAVSTGP